MRYIVSLVIAMVFDPAATLTKVTAVPTAYETELFAGMVQVKAPVVSQ
jgi:hypothetical protein